MLVVKCDENGNEIFKTPGRRFSNDRRSSKGRDKKAPMDDYESYESYGSYESYESDLNEPKAETSKSLKAVKAETPKSLKIETSKSLKPPKTEVPEVDPPINDDNHHQDDDDHDNDESSQDNVKTVIFPLTVRDAESLVAHLGRKSDYLAAALGACSTRSTRIFFLVPDASFGHDRALYARLSPHRRLAFADPASLHRSRCPPSSLQIGFMHTTPSDLKRLIADKLQSENASMATNNNARAKGRTEVVVAVSSFPLSHDEHVSLPEFLEHCVSIGATYVCLYIKNPMERTHLDFSEERGFQYRLCELTTGTSEQTRFAAFCQKKQ